MEGRHSRVHAGIRHEHARGESTMPPLRASSEGGICEEIGSRVGTSDTPSRNSRGGPVPFASSTSSSLPSETNHSASPPPPPSADDISINAESKLSIEPVGRVSLFPRNKVSRIITKIFKKKIDPEGYTWKTISKEFKNIYWREFHKYIAYDSKIETLIRECYDQQASTRYTELMCKLRGKKNKKPDFVPLHVWDRWWLEWDILEYKKKREQASENRRNEFCGVGTGLSVHTGGSKSADGHARDLAKKLNREPTMHEIFERMHWNKKENKWVDNRSSNIA